MTTTIFHFPVVVKKTDRNFGYLLAAKMEIVHIRRVGNQVGLQHCELVGMETNYLNGWVLIENAVFEHSDLVGTEPYLSDRRQLFEKVAGQHNQLVAIPLDVVNLRVLIVQPIGQGCDLVAGPVVELEIRVLVKQVARERNNLVVVHVEVRQRLLAPLPLHPPRSMQAGRYCLQR